MNRNDSKPTAFNKDYFSTGPYAGVNFAKYSQYWWSNRYYALLACRHGPRQGRVLEIGCGLGHLLAWMTGHYQVFGCDVNAWAVAQAKRNVPQGSFLQLSADEGLAFPSQVFEIVIAKHVVEHLPNPERAISEMSRILKKGGLLVLATPNLSSPMRKRKGEHWIGYTDPTHISLKPPEEWLGLIHRYGFQLRKIFSDGFWDAPYIPYVPARLQKLIFGAPGGLQAILGWSIIPVRMGESLIILADKA